VINTSKGGGASVAKLDPPFRRTGIEALQAKIQEMQPSNAEIKALHEALQTEIQDVSSKEILHLKSALQAQLSIIRASANDSPVEILRKWLARIKSPEAVKKVFCLVLPILASV
jgi:hypothetical protein